MKKQKVLSVMLLSLVVITLICILSYHIEARSQKLPALISSDKIIVCSAVDGLLKSYGVTSMQKVEKNGLIAEITNSRLPYKLETLKKEKAKYEELINSAHSGDFLKTELYGLDEDIQANQTDLEKAKLSIKKTNEKLILMRDRFNSGQKKYEADRTLYNQGILGNTDFDKATKDFWDVNKEYTELRNDSLTALQIMKSSQNIINLLLARKKILSNNVDMLAAKYLIDLNSVDADINDLEQEVKNFHIYSPISGVVTDINYLPGENIDKGDVVAEIADLSHVWVIAYGMSSASHRIKSGQKVRILCDAKHKLWGTVSTVSPVMEKVKSLSSSFETANTYVKIEVNFINMGDALKYITPGERLFIRIYFH
jgi:multidrug resistance efflux pump